MAVEIPQQRCVVQADPTAFAIFDVRSEGCLRLGYPTVGNEVQLQHQPVIGEVLCRDCGRVADVVDFETVFLAAFFQPGSSGFGESNVVAACLCQGKQFERRFGPESEGAMAAVMPAMIQDKRVNLFITSQDAEN